MPLWAVVVGIGALLLIAFALGVNHACHRVSRAAARAEQAINSWMPR